MEKLRELRKSKNLSMKELGIIVGVAESTISLYENGKRQPDNETLIRIADYFNVSIDYLLGRNEETKKSPPTDLSEGESEWLELYYALTDENRELMLKMVSAFKDLPAERRRFVLDAIRLAANHQK